MVDRRPIGSPQCRGSSWRHSPPCRTECKCLVVTLPCGSGRHIFGSVLVAFPSFFSGDVFLEVKSLSIFLCVIFCRHHTWHMLPEHFLHSCHKTRTGWLAGCHKRHMCRFAFVWLDVLASCACLGTVCTIVPCLLTR